MSGFVGSNARRRRRNFFLFSILFLFVVFFFFIFPSLEQNNNEIIPSGNVIPDPQDDLTSIASDTEELELDIFKKDQKIKFRDGQIKNLESKLQELQSQNKSLIYKVNEIRSEFSNEDLISFNKFNLLQEKFTELNLENDKNISLITKLNKNFKLVDKEKNNIISENKNLKKNIKNLFAKNLRLENTIDEFKNKINEQKTEIDLLLDQLKKIKDQSHHGD